MQADTGGAQPTSISPLVYSLLQLVSRARGNGITVVEVGKTLGIDQRSAFHYVRAGVVAGCLHVPPCSPARLVSR